MAAPTDLEQYLLELINEARLDPLRNAERYIASYAPLAASDPHIEGALDYFRVDGAQLLAAYKALVPAEPLAWNSALEDAASKHSAAMIAADEQSHRLPGEPALAQRILNQGYNFTLAGENVYAYAESPLYAHAGFMVDWGAGPGGMQSPAGHRDSIMNARFREVGIDVTRESSSATAVGPLVVSQEFGARFGKAFILGVAYADRDDDGFYSPGEGRGDLRVASGSSSVSSAMSGGYSLEMSQASEVTFSGGGLSGPVTVRGAFSATGADNVKFDIVDGTILLTSASAMVSGAIGTVKVLGTRGLRLETGAGAQSLVGGPGDDTLIGGLGNDDIDGGEGLDRAVFTGSRADYRIALNGSDYRVADRRPGGDGEDTVRAVELFAFTDGEFRPDSLLDAPVRTFEGSFRLVTMAGFVGAVGGNGVVFGDSGQQEVRIVWGSGAITLDGSFGRGGDVVRLDGDAGDYTARLAGSSAVLAGGGGDVTIPIGEAGLDLAFADGVRTLVYDAGAGAAKIGGQAIGTAAAPIGAAAETPALPAGTHTGVAARLILTADAAVEFEGDAHVFGTSGAETVHLLGGSVSLDGSFARGGDTLVLDRGADAFSAFVSGSFVTLTGTGSLRIVVPIGSAGIDLDFAGDVRDLGYDPAAGVVLIGDQAVSATSEITAPALQPQHFV